MICLSGHVQTEERQVMWCTLYMIMLNANKDYPENKQKFLLNKKKEPLVRPTPPSDVGVSFRTQSSEYVRGTACRVGCH